MATSKAQAKGGGKRAAAQTETRANQAAGRPSNAAADSKADLAQRQCVPCRGGVPAIKGRELEGLIRHAKGWEAVDEHHITRTFEFPDFRTALEFTNKVGAIAEQQGHHPDILLSWGKVGVTLYTHKIDGLTENDFIMAARINRL